MEAEELLFLKGEHASGNCGAPGSLVPAVLLADRQVQHVEALCERQGCTPLRQRLLTRAPRGVKTNPTPWL